MGDGTGPDRPRALTPSHSTDVWSSGIGRGAETEIGKQGPETDEQGHDGERNQSHPEEADKRGYRNEPERQREAEHGQVALRSGNGRLHEGWRHRRQGIPEPFR